MLFKLDNKSERSLWNTKCYTVSTDIISSFQTYLNFKTKDDIFVREYANKSRVLTRLYWDTRQTTKCEQRSTEFNNFCYFINREKNDLLSCQLKTNSYY